MCVCICVCAYVYVCLCVYVCVHVYICVYACRYMFANLCMGVCVHGYMCMWPMHTVLWITHLPCNHIQDSPGSYPLGNGNCFCDSCSCNQDYTGYACSCPTSQLKCVEPGAKVWAWPSSGWGSGHCIILFFSPPPPQSVCSNAGQCLCGICICNNVTARIGTYCEACKVCCGEGERWEWCQCE